MTRDQQLLYCRVCKNQSFSPEYGVICSLTGRQADFETSCVNFASDQAVEEIHVQAIKAKGLAVLQTSAGKRFANYVIDLIALLLLYFVLGVMSAIVVLVFFPEAVDTMERDIDRFNWIFTLGIYFLYYTILESSAGRTLGKLVTGTKVVDEQGKTPGIGTIMLRTVSRWVPFEAFSFLGSDVRGWHDSWTNTYVVDVKNDVNAAGRH
jgi:uncharacterized RDD family membrane protein YckC